MTIVKSMSYSFVNVRSVIFSFSNYFTQSSYECINNEGIKTICYTESLYNAEFPYIIHFLSPTIVPVYIQLEVQEKKKKITPEQLIGIVCGVAAVFFIILGIIILFIRKNKKREISYDIEMSTSEEDLNQIQTKTITISNANLPDKIDGDIDNWI